MSGDDKKPPLYPPNVPKPPPLPVGARDLRAPQDLQSYELEAVDRKPRRASTINSGDGVPVRTRRASSDAGSSWVRIAFLLLVLAAVSVGAYVWKGR